MFDGFFPNKEENMRKSCDNGSGIPAIIGKSDCWDEPRGTGGSMDGVSKSCKNTGETVILSKY